MVRAATLLLVACLSVACAYHNPTAPTLAADDLGAPTTLTIGTQAGARPGTTLVTAHVLNLHGTPLTNMIVVFATSLGDVSPSAANTGAEGSASTTLTAAGDARVSVTVGPMHSSTLIAALPGTATPTPPTAGVFLNVVSSALTGSPVPFSVSSAASGPWAWSFGDGGSDQTTAFSTTHTYGRSGVYVATVSGSGTAAASATVTVTDPPPAPIPPPAALGTTMTCAPGVHGAGAANPTACNVRVTYGGTALPGNAITTVAWDWSDGTTNTSPTPVQTHPYVSAGTYVVFATVTATTVDGPKTALTSTSVIVP